MEQQNVAPTTANVDEQENPLEISKREHNQAIDDVIQKIQNNNFTIYVYCPAMNQPSGGIGVLLKTAKTLKDNGYNVKIIYEPIFDQKASYEESVRQKKEVHIFQKFNPTWLDFSVSDIEFVALGDKDIILNDKDRTVVKSQPLSALPEDFLLIPEGFPNIMEKTIQVPCKRIVFAQSWFYILNAMQPGQKWQHFGINDVISVSDAITEYINTIMPGTKIKSLKQGINRNLFKAPTKMSSKFPMVAFTGNRGQENKMKTHNIIRTFYQFYPHLRWVRFIELGGMDREQFAERLASCAFVLYTDDIAGFGTLPLEAMASGTHVVGWAPYGGKEYINNENGFWTANGDIFTTAEILGVAIDKWLRGEMDTAEIQDSYEKTLASYTPEKEKEAVLNIVNEYKTERIADLESIKRK